MVKRSAVFSTLLIRNPGNSKGMQFFIIRSVHHLEFIPRGVLALYLPIAPKLTENQAYTPDKQSETSVVRPPEFPYYLRDHFLSPAELSFYQVLRTAVAGRATISTKVALADVFWVKSPDDHSRFRIYTNKIDRKQVDFLLCDPATMQPLLGIELDDKSHQREDRRDRDVFVNQVFAAAKLPLLHIPAKRAYVVAELAAQLAPYLGESRRQVAETASPVIKPISVQPLAQPDAKPESRVDAPVCPKCGSEMILRTAKSGANAGNQFWGCSTYPKCRGMVAV